MVRFLVWRGSVVVGKFLAIECSLWRNQSIIGDMV